MARDTYADALLNFVIVLEALLLRGEKTELTYRFKINGANYLSNSFAEKELRYNQLGELYEFRSRLVHGGKKYPVKRSWKKNAYKRIAYHGLGYCGLSKTDSRQQIILESGHSA